MSFDKRNATKIGNIGEEKVAQYLKSKGYIIVKRNWKDRYGEVDIIAEKDNILAFVEVKTRAEIALVSGLEAIDRGKMLRIKNEAEQFTKRMIGDYTARIDVAEVTYSLRADGKVYWKLNYIKSAF